MPTFAAHFWAEVGKQSEKLSQKRRRRLVAHGHCIPLATKAAAAHGADCHFARFHRRSNSPAGKKSDASAPSGQFNDCFRKRNFDDAIRLDTRGLEQLIDQRALFPRRINQNRFSFQVWAAPGLRPRGGAAATSPKTIRLRTSAWRAGSYCREHSS